MCHLLTMELEMRMRAFTFLLFWMCLYSCGDCAKLSSCHENPCKNDGKCYRVGSSPEAPMCPDGFLPYDDNCYNLVQRPATWLEADRHCRSLGAQLLVVDGQRKREFVKAYMQSQLAGQQTNDWRNVWTCGRSERRRVDGQRPTKAVGEGGFEWNWASSANPPVDRPIQKPVWFWQGGEPKAQMPLDDACLAISADSQYLMWLAESCSSAQNFYVCERRVERLLEVEPSDNYHYQCMCKMGFYGFHCEHGSAPNAPPESWELFSCMDHALNINCSKTMDLATMRIASIKVSNSFGCSFSIHGKLLMFWVDYVMYGMYSTNDKPPMCSGEVDETECASENALMLLRQRCQGRSSCQISANFSDVFPVNPCRPDSVNYAKYRLRCDTAPMHCPDERMDSTGGACYDLVKANVPSQRRNWMAARGKCVQRGGDLAGPIEETTFKFLEQKLRGILALEPDKTHTFWIGLTTNHLGQPYWQTNERMTFGPTGSQFLRNKCVAMQIGGGGYTTPPVVTYHAIQCDMPHSWICQFPTEEGPRPSLYDENWSQHTAADSDSVTTDDTWYVWPESTTSGRSSSPTSLETVSISPQRCSSIEARAVTWPETLESELALMPCPPGTTGRATWRCERVSPSEVRFVPATPDMSGCRHAFIDSLQQRVEQRDAAVDIGANLTQQLRRSQSRLYGGDVAGGLDVLSALLPLARQQLTDERTATRFSREVGDAANLMLTDSVLPVWNDMPRHKRMVEATSLMSTLEDSANLWAQYLATGSKETFKYSNMAMKVEVIGSMPTLVPLAPLSSTPVGMLGDSDDRSTKLSFSVDDAFGQDAIEGGFEDSFGQFAPNFTLPSAATLNAASQPLFSTSVDAPPEGRLGPFEAPIEAPDTLKLGYFLYTNLGKLLSPKPPTGNSAASVSADSVVSSRSIVNSLVLGASVNRRLESRSVRLPNDEPATFNFRHLIANQSVSNPRCVFWNTKTNGWDPAGCRVARTDAVSTVCECNHLTSFAVLMDFGGNAVQVAAVHRRILDWVTMIGCALSCFCLLLSIVIFTAFRSLWCNRNTIHRNLCICLLAATLVFLIGIDRTENAAVCTGVAVLLHYLFLAAFCWMLLEGYQLYLMLCQVFDVEKPKTLVFILLAYGVPGIIVAVSAGVASQNYGTDKYCWIDVNSPTIWAFVGPVTVVILANMVFLLVALKVVFGVHSIGDRSVFRRLKGWTKGSAMLLCLLGVTWVFGYFIAVNRTHVVFVYIFTVLNCLQGVFIFVFHVLGNDKARLVIHRWLRDNCSCCFSERKKSSSAFNSSSFWSSGQRLRHLMNFNSGGSAGDNSQSTASTGATTGPRSPVSATTPPLDEGWKNGDAKNPAVSDGAMAKVTEAALLAHLEPGHLCSKECQSAQSLPQPGVRDPPELWLTTPPPPAVVDDDVRRNSSTDGSASPGGTTYHFTYIETGRESKGRIVYRNPTFVARF